ncbi:MAG: hypothetical protein JST80_13005 [Bdellovibrionales bacterium]|nr:hypothetical protein [Bdellovibrionales bacterium]
MGKISIIVLLLSTSAYATTTQPSAVNDTNDIYSDSLKIEKSSAEVPDSLEASVKENDPELDGQPIESVADIAAKSAPKAKKSAKK